MVYVRWHNLTGAMELQGGGKHFDIANARERFDAYAPGRAALASQRHKAKVQDSSLANATGLRKPAAASGPGAAFSPKVDNTPKEPENPFLNEDL